MDKNKTTEKSAQAISFRSFIILPQSDEDLMKLSPVNEMPALANQKMTI